MIKKVTIKNVLVTLVLTMLSTTNPILINSSTTPQWTYQTISAGTLDGSFGGGDGKVTTNINGGDIAYGVAIQSDGKIVVVGESNSSFGVARYNTDGSLDTSFDTDGFLTTNFGSVDAAYGVAIQSDGKIVVSGNSGNDFAVARYNTDGSLDTTFDTDGKLTTDIGSSSTDVAYGVAIQADGKIVVVGDNGSDFAVVRYNTDGSLDTTFDTDGKLTTDIGTATADTARAVTIQTDGKIVVVGRSANDFAVVRYLNDIPPLKQIASNGNGGIAG
ncbi:MAG: putative delta-60 repeat protein [Alteromonas naphthalenivorans]|jgi:uncharacterized delta-60 repeat protein